MRRDLEGYLALCFVFTLLGCVNHNPYDEYDVKPLSDLNATHEWNIELDSANIDLLNLRRNAGSTELSAYVKFSSSRTCRGCLHGMINLGDIPKFTVYSSKEHARATFVNDTSLILINDVGDSSMFWNFKDSDLTQLAILSPPSNYFAGNYYDMVESVQDWVYISATSGKYELRDQHENELYYQHIKPLLRVDLNNLTAHEFVGSYPSDYPEKRVYAYHMDPLLNVHAKGYKLYYSFPGSKFLHMLNHETGYEKVYTCKSRYHVEYHSMDTSDFMMISKAIQFQDTVSRYDRIGVSNRHQKCARVYYMNKPAELNGKSYNASIVIFDLKTEKTTGEFLFNSQHIHPRLLLFHDDGLVILRKEGAASSHRYVFENLPIYE